MKTIAITIDESTLKLLDGLAGTERGRRGRSALVRSAVREFAIRERQRLFEEQERAILKSHRKQLGRQARLLIAEQARP
jgi:metal-responsive CopG/Arc/MetJ family transcriptional regulator